MENYDAKNHIIADVYDLIINAYHYNNFHYYLILLFILIFHNPLAWSKKTIIP